MARKEKDSRRELYLITLCDHEYKECNNLH